jgi:hypothetical protein
VAKSHVRDGAVVCDCGRGRREDGMVARRRGRKIKVEGGRERERGGYESYDHYTPGAPI